MKLDIQGLFSRICVRFVRKIHTMITSIIWTSSFTNKLLILQNVLEIRYCLIVSSGSSGTLLARPEYS